MHLFVDFNFGFDLLGDDVLCATILHLHSNSLSLVQFKVCYFFLFLCCNLKFDAKLSAMLTVSDNEFWEGISPVEFGDLPALQDAVTVVGYPIGGDAISVTSGVVSRMEILTYVHSSAKLLGMQVDTLYIVS